MISVQASPNNAANTGQVDNSVKNKPVSFMFVLSAKKAQFKPGKNGNTLLIVKKADLIKIIRFSDRPYRIIRDMTESALNKAWKENCHSFIDIPPNAVLSGANMKPQIVIINSMCSQDSLLTLTLKGDIPGNTVQSMTLTIDNKLQGASSYQPNRKSCCNYNSYYTAYHPFWPFNPTSTFDEKLYNKCMGNGGCVPQCICSQLPNTE